MAKVDHRGLVQRLARVEALRQRATSPGEQAAATRARDRLVDRITRERAADPVAHFVQEHFAGLETAPVPPAPPPGELPSPVEVAARMRAWARGAFAADEIAVWAAEVVDRVELPVDPEAEGAVVGEILLQLSASAWPSVRLAPAAQAFLSTRDWEAWFAVVASGSSR